MFKDMINIDTYTARRVPTSPIEEGILPDNWLLLNILFESELHVNQLNFTSFINKWGYLILTHVLGSYLS